ncbi:MAG: G5 domain-containing protein [Dehalococcoidia bacterium]|nr:G5 domain-containing protein [Dehalococcoidia bacterium]
MTIARTRVVEEEEREAIAPNTVYETDSSMSEGQVRIIEGKQGIRLVRYEATYRNGELVNREAIGSEVLEEPTPTRHITGVSDANSGAPQAASEPAPEPDSSGGFSGNYRTKMTVLTTWYNATHGGKDRDNPWYGYTSTGAKLRKGICATDPSVIPLGTWMYIPGYGRCLAADIGGAVKGKHVDLGFPESAGDSQWGMKTMEIYILD